MARLDEVRDEVSIKQISDLAITEEASTIETQRLNMMFGSKCATKCKRSLISGLGRQRLVVAAFGPPHRPLWAIPPWLLLPAIHDVIIRNGVIYDGSGRDPVVGDVTIDGDKLVGMGPLTTARGRTEIDANGLAVAPGFINMLSWATETLITDGRSQSDIRQGVTLEVFGEGIPMGPLNDDDEEGPRRAPGRSQVCRRVDHPGGIP